MMRIMNEKNQTAMTVTLEIVVLIPIKLLILIKKLEKYLYLWNTMKINYRHSFSFLFILNLLNISVPENAEPVINYSFGVLILSLLVFFNIINAFLSLFSLYIIKIYNVDERLKNYPRLKRIVKYYEGSSLVFISIEIGMALIFTLVIFLSCLFFLGINIFE
uniref:Uncharacterized protein n=1 Tax=Lactifluus piperatus TaxID=71966 RepID=A0A2Z4M936_9AGAM|nr:hypothetical protein [Lactifluus piperatus]AWX53012.1 hypothetical protein [Lactifluus piperatus]